MTHPHEGPQVRARSGSDLMTKARNLLADQYEANGSKEFAVEIRTGNLNRVGMGCAISAIVKALALPHQSAPAEPALMYMLNLFAADRYPSALTMHEMTKEFLSTLPQQAATDEGEGLPALIHRYYMRQIGKLMHQAQHWHENSRPFAVHHRVMKADAYFQVANLFDPKQRELGHKCPFEQMRNWLALAEKWETGSYPPSPELHRYRDPVHVVALSTPTSQPPAAETRLRDMMAKLAASYATALKPAAGWTADQVGWWEIGVADAASAIACAIRGTALTQPEPTAQQAPVDMLLFCPRCHTQHIDEPDDRTPEWSNPPHRSHLCHSCGCIWRPADIATNGVASIATVGKADNWSAQQATDCPDCDGTGYRQASTAHKGGECPTCAATGAGPAQQAAGEAEAVRVDDLIYRIDRAIERETINLPLKANIATIETLRRCRAALYATPQPTETQRIVAWPREDACKTREDLRRLHAARKLTIGQTAEWENLIGLKSGIADAIERGEHLAGEGQ